MNRLEMIAILLGIVLVVSGVANGHGDHHVEPTGDSHTSLKYDRRGLGGAPAGGAAAGGAAAGGAAAGPGGVIDISKAPGAKGDGSSDMTQILNKAWTDACKGTAKSTILIPAGIWFHGFLDFKGPCSSPPPITINLQGTLKAKNDAASYPQNTHISFYSASVMVMGGGTVDGNGAVLQSQRQKNDKNLPDSMGFSQCPNSGVEGIKFVNAKGFNLKATESENFKATKLTITAGGDTLNTDGIHIARLKGGSILDTNIGVGDDCISIGDAMVDLTIRNIQCGPGHGISIGSLGKFPDEKDVRNVEVHNVTFTGTTNGVRIKTFHNSPVLAVNNVTFSDIVVKDVYNPILIDQHYNAGNAPSTTGVSKVKISGITFKNIKGSTLSNEAITLNCSAAAPCEGITVQDVQFTYSGNNTVDKGLRTQCENAKAVFTTTTPPGCA